MKTISYRKICAAIIASLPLIATAQMTYTIPNNGNGYDADLGGYSSTYAGNWTGTPGYADWATNGTRTNTSITSNTNVALADRVFVFGSDWGYKVGVSYSFGNFSVMQGVQANIGSGAKIGSQQIYLNNANTANSVQMTVGTAGVTDYYNGRDYKYLGALILKNGSSYETSAGGGNTYVGAISGGTIIRGELIMEGGVNSVNAPNNLLDISLTGAMIWRAPDNSAADSSKFSAWSYGGSVAANDTKTRGTFNGSFTVDLAGLTGDVVNNKLINIVTPKASVFEGLLLDWLKTEGVKTSEADGSYIRDTYTITGSGDFAKSITVANALGAGNDLTYDLFTFKNASDYDWTISWSETDILGNASGSKYLMFSATEVPEPSTYAAIFGLLSLGFVIFRKRK